jgi:AraC-like DNA-binding protein
MQIDQIIADNILLLFNYLIIAETALAIMAVFILFVFKRNKNANFFLGLFIITYSVSFLPYYFYKNDLLIPAFLLSSFTLPANSLIGVFLYFYTLYMTGRVEKLNKKDIIHFLSFMVLMIIYFSACIVYYISFINSYDLSDLHHIPVPAAFLMIAGGAIVNSIIYTVLSYFKIRNYSRVIRNYASDVESMDLSWLKKIIYFSIFATVVFFICFSITVGTLSSLYFISIDTAVFIIMLFILVYYIINQPELINENREMYSVLNNLNMQLNNTPEKRYEKINLDLRTQEAYLKQLDEYMEKHKPYLNERITIKDLSEGLNMPYYHLSMVINNLLNKNFYDFINEYRIREVLNILDKSKNEPVNILTIAFKCGFNSKSTFNRVFKNKTGTTPSLYKNTRS